MKTLSDNVYELEREKRYSLFVAEKELKENFSHRGWKNEHSFARHKFHAEKIQELNKKLAGLKLI